MRCRMCWPVLGIVVLLVGVWIWIAASRQTAAAPAEPSSQSGVDEPDDASQWQAPPEALARWQAMRFGMFIHWGPVSLKGTEIGWSRGAAVPVEEYDNLYRRFNPTEFDADEWVAVAKAAGMKYLVITSKHHDGFCLWDSAYTDYDIMSTPFGRDVLKELSEACRRQGVVFCTYHSICDWHHPDYPLGSPGGRTKKPNPNMPRYVQYLHNQTREIIEKYGPLGVMWFDGEWESPWTHDHGLALYRHIRSLQPDILINNRVDKGRRGMEGTIKGPDFVGDFDTPEQRVGTFNRQRPWETCMTICRQWAWKPNDQLKTLQQCLGILLRTAGGDGNLLLNVGPMPNGRIEPRQVERLRQIGHWLAQYGDGVYGTRGGPFKPGRWGASTCKGNQIYLFVMHWPESGPLQLPPVPQQIESLTVRTGGKATWDQSASGITLDVPASDRQRLVTVIEMTVAGRALDIPPVTLPPLSGAVSAGKAARASNVYRKQRANFGPQMAVDDDPETRWATDAGTHKAWLEVDLGKPTTVGQAVILEAYSPRVQQFQLQAWDGKQWKPFYDGRQIASGEKINFPPITTQKVRLEILQAAEGPTIWEFQLFAPSKGK